MDLSILSDEPFQRTIWTILSIYLTVGRIFHIIKADKEIIRTESGGENAMDRYLKETEMLNYSSKNIRQLIAKRKWDRLDAFRRVQAIYNFVRDEILFGYNTDDSIPASKVLADGYGQCNTKGTLFMALLRACRIPCRVHGFTIDKALQKGCYDRLCVQKRTAKCISQLGGGVPG